MRLSKALQAAKQMAEYVVKHDLKHNRFIAEFQDGAQGVLEYRTVAPNTIDFYHTEVGSCVITLLSRMQVPKAKEGKGVASALVKVCTWFGLLLMDQAGMEWIVQSGAKTASTCSYVRDTFLPRHQEYKDHVARL